MTIYFNPYYSSSAFVDEADCGLGISFLGPHSLLCELELRAGCSRGSDDGTRRTIRYMQAMSKALADNAGIFFAKSFERDDLGTAEVLLRWRDSIRRCGWTPYSGSKSEKLRGLAEIEPNFDSEGPADRWREILSIVKGRAVLAPSDTIEVTCAKEDLEPLYREVLGEIEKHGTKVAYANNLEVEKKPDILCFPNDIEAHEWLSTQAFSGNDLLVGAERGLLNDMLYAEGRPLVGNSEESIGPVMRLFTLGLSLFSNPVNAIDLLAYLQLPKNPVNTLHVKCERKDGTAYYRSLGRILANILCRQGGMGEGWEKNINEAIYDFEGKVLDEEKRKEKLAFISMWEQTDKATGKVSRDDVRNYVSLLGKWARGHFKKSGEQPDELDPQYHALESYCQTMILLLDGQEKEVTASQIAMWAGRIMHPITLAGEYARRGSINIVGNLGNIHSSPNNLYWFTAEVRSDSGYEFSFLSKKDIEELESHGTVIPEREAMLKAARNISINSLARCKGKVTVVTCTRIGSEQTTPNLIVAELTQKFGLKISEEPFIRPVTESSAVISDNGKVCEVGIRKYNLDDYGKPWSASSIEKLINHPYDFYISSILGLTGYGSDGIADEIIIKGNIAHRYIHSLGESQGHNLSKMISEHKTGFDERFDSVTREKGIILMSEGKAIDYRNFKADIRDSVQTLLKMMSDMGLKIVAQEYPFEVTLPPFGRFKGFVDCLLQDRNGDYVIFDFKYGWQEHKAKIEEGRSVQLALYRKAIEIDKGGKVSFCGYYSFMKSELYSADTPLHPAQGFEPIVPDHPADTFLQVCNSFIYRKQQFADGILEEADGLALADIQYFKDMNVYNLLHLEHVGGVTKKHTYDKENHILKGDLV